MIPFLHRLPAVAAEDSPLWLIVLADMMTNLMLFFLIMFSYILQGPKAREQMVRTFDAAGVVDVRPGLAESAARLDVAEERAAAKLRALFADTDVDERMIRVRLRSQILFPSGRSALSAEADEPIAKLARVLEDMSSTVVVEGHTDDAPLRGSAYRSNWELSVARSNAVIEGLVRGGVPPERLVAAGYGEHRPVSPNDSLEGRARNRRVEVIILRGEGARDE